MIGVFLIGVFGSSTVSVSDLRLMETAMVRKSEAGLGLAYCRQIQYDVAQLTPDVEEECHGSSRRRDLYQCREWSRDNVVEK